MSTSTPPPSKKTPKTVHESLDLEKLVFLKPHVTAFAETDSSEARGDDVALRAPAAAHHRDARRKKRGRAQPVSDALCADEK